MGNKEYMQVTRHAGRKAGDRKQGRQGTRQTCKKAGRQATRQTCDKAGT